MFHLVSQTALLVLTPSNFLICTIVVGLVIALSPRTVGSGRRLVFIAAGFLGILALLPVGDLLLLPLETRFPPYTRDGGIVASIVVLGGSVSAVRVAGKRYPRPNEAADRLFTAARLARQYPEARVIVTGGPVDPASGTAEADFVARDLEDLGVAPARLSEDRWSADTFQNARASVALARPQRNERWLLVTSAFHMPRAIGVFRSAGFDVVAAPADWRASRWEGHLTWSVPGNLGKVDLAWKEYAGLLVYRLSGRTRELFPAP